MKKWWCAWLFCTVSCFQVLRAQSGAWTVDADGIWSSSANWLAGAVANGAGATAFFTNTVTSRRTVDVDGPVSVEALRFGSPAYNNWRLIGDGPVILDGAAKPRIGSTVNQRVEILTPLAGTNGVIQESLPGDIELAGDNSGLAGLAELRSYTVAQTMSKTAGSTAPLVRDYFPTGGVIMAGARFELFGRKNGSAVVSPNWAVVQNSARVQASITNATVNLAPGQRVTGNGIPADTYIRQILDGSNLVLSAAAELSDIETLTFEAATFRSEQLLQRVRVEGGQDFRVHRNGGSSFTVEVERVYGPANWALKNGDAVIKVPGLREHRGTLQLHSVDLTLAPKIVTRQPAAGPSFHVDASRADTLTLEGSAVSEWRDVNGNGLYAKAPGLKPTLLADALNGRPVVDFGTFGTSPYMHWFNAQGQVELTSIRAVFWVLGSQNGGGFLLGGLTTAHFHRGNAPDGVFYPVQTSSQLWGHDWNTYPGGGRVETYIDGLRAGASSALSGGYQVIACQIATNVTAGGFATDRNTFPDRRGGQRLAEVIIYDRPLTELERIETEEYLMAKWFGDTRWDLGGQAPTVNDLNALGTRTVNTPDSGVTTIGRLSGGGRLSLTGAGELALADAQEYAGTIALAGGGLRLTAAAVPETPAADAYFHVDASVAESLTLDVDGRVLAWHDWRGNGRAAAVAPGFNTPALLAHAQNGYPVVDFGAIGSLQALAWNHTNNTIRAAFIVIQSLSGAAQVLGGVSGQPQDFFRNGNGPLYYSGDTTASRAVVYGANYVNGWRVEPLFAALPSGFCVVSVIPTTPARASAFAQDRDTGSRSGGQRLAEVILYTRALSDAERRGTEAYLMRKWLNRAAPGYGAPELTQIPAVSYTVPSFSVRVEGDGTAALGQLTGGGTVVKSGSGTLALGRGPLGLAGAIEVEEGTVSAVAPSDLAPAPFPVFHVDATQTNAMTFVQENGTNFITRWTSRAPVANAAVERAGYRLPYLLTNDLNGLPAVGFGPFGTTGSSLKWETAVTSVRSVFVVLGSQEGGAFVLGGTATPHFHRGNRGNTFLPITKDNALYGWDVSSHVVNGTTYLDGARVANPTSQALSGGYQLIEVLTLDAVTADLFGGDRAFADRAGGLRLAEVIVYDRLLTEYERVQTENYLMAKWFGRTAPGAGLGTVKVADQTGIRADGSPMTVHRLIGEAAVVKVGSDTLTLRDTTAFTGTVEVTAGTLNLAVPAAPLAPPAGTLFWVDASCPGTIDTDTTGGVTEWRDVTGNGRYARPFAGRSAPTLRGNDFAGLPAVDMGPYGIAGSAGMLWNARLTGMRTVAWVLGSQTSGGYLLGATNATTFHRGPPPEGGQIAVTNFTYRNYMLSSSWGAATPTAAYTNGVPVNTTVTSLSGGYQIIVMTWSGGTYADGFAFDRLMGDRYGGQRLAEFLVYDRVITEQERSDLDAYLNQKWFGVQTAGYALPVTHTGVILHEGAALTMNGGEQSVVALSGSGVVSNGTLAVTENLSPGLADAACATLAVAGNLTLGDGLTCVIDLNASDADAVAVSGELSLAGGGTVTLRVPLEAGAWTVGNLPLFSFGSLEGAQNLSAWSVAGLPPGYGARLFVEGQNVCLSIFVNGSLLMVR